MDHRELKRLVQLMNDNGLVELEIEREGARVHLRKAGAMQVAGMPAYGPPGYPTGYPAGYPMPGAPMPGQPGAAPADEPEEPSGPPPGTEEIVSPMVGTFYRKPSPDADPYCKVGDGVDGESVVCIIEAMKVNNEIKAEMSGEIVEILVEDGHPVEFGQPLFRVRVA